MDFDSPRIHAACAFPDDLGEVSRVRRSGSGPTGLID